MGIVAIHKKIKLPKRKGYQKELQLCREILEHDKTYLGDMIRISKREAELISEKYGDPYIVFNFTIFNGSALTIYLDNNISGNIFIKGKFLSQKPQLIKPNSGYHLPHGRELRVRLRQPITNEMKEYIWKEYQNNSFEFNFSEIKIPIKIVDVDAAGMPLHRLKLNKEIFPINL